MSEIQYFAYGSNMDPTEMQERCPGCIEIGNALLRNYNLMINSSGYATVTPCDGKSVYGVLWALTPQHLINLDSYEGVDYGEYRREIVRVSVNNQERNAEIYVANNVTPGSAVNDYWNRVLASALRRNFPIEYVNELMRWQSKSD